MEQEEHEIEISEQIIHGAAAIVGTAGLRSIVDVSHHDDIETEHSTREKSDRIDALHCVWFESLKK